MKATPLSSLMTAVPGALGSFKLTLGEGDGGGALLPLEEAWLLEEVCALLPWLEELASLEGPSSDTSLSSPLLSLSSDGAPSWEEEPEELGPCSGCPKLAQMATATTAATTSSASRMIWSFLPFKTTSPFP